MPFSIRLLAVAVAASLSAGAVLGAEVNVTNSLRGLSPVPTREELEGGLLAFLRAAEDDDESGGSVLAQRLGKIEVSLGMTYQALQKNDYGRLAPRSVHYLVHSYFMKEHGWLIKGLEPRGFHLNVGEAESVRVLKDQVPAVLEELLESRHAHNGLSLGDVVAMVALMEHLVLDQSVDLIRTAYELTNRSDTDAVDEESMHMLLMTYMLLIRRPTLEREEHEEWLEDFHSGELETENFLTKAVEFEQAMFNNTAFEQTSRSNPFEEKQYNFEAISRFADRLMHQYGQFQHEECLSMKASLMSLDPTGEGLIPLSSFYLASDEYGYWESTEYLSAVGALDESVPGNLRVRIANYVLGPSNCIANSEYYSICCLDECKAIQSELEGAVKAPRTTPERLLRLVSAISSNTVDAPRVLGADLSEKLHGIAEHHGGQVPLHGRLFTQWLHFAFPNECPYPQILSQASALQVDHWGDDRHVVSPVEALRHVGAAKEAEAAAAAQFGQSAFAQWTDDEVLPLMESPRRVQVSTLAALCRCAAFLGLLGVVLRLALAKMTSIRAARAGAAGVEKASKAGTRSLPV